MVFRASTGYGISGAVEAVGVSVVPVAFATSRVYVGRYWLTGAEMPVYNIGMAGNSGLDGRQPDGGQGDRLGRPGHGSLGLMRWLIGLGLPAGILGLVACEVSEELIDMDRPHVTDALRRVIWRRKTTWK